VRTPETDDDTDSVAKAVEARRGEAVAWWAATKQRLPRQVCRRERAKTKESDSLLREGHRIFFVLGVLLGGLRRRPKAKDFFLTR
jgi:hypothetical protein